MSLVIRNVDVEYLFAHDDISVSLKKICVYAFVRSIAQYDSEPWTLLNKVEHNCHPNKNPRWLYLTFVFNHLGDFPHRQAYQKDGEKRIHAFGMLVWRRMLRIGPTQIKTNIWVIYKLWVNEEEGMLLFIKRYTR